MKLTASIAEHNEEALIAEAINSISFAYEITVYDMGSDDKTVSIAEKLGAKVFIIPKPKVVEYCRNDQIIKAKGDWVLIIDADERVTPELAQEIQASLEKADGVGAFAIPRLNYTFGKLLKYGGWNGGTDYQIRLIRKSSFIDWPKEVHSTPRFSGKLVKLANPFIHLKDRSIEDMVERTNRYSDMEAGQYYKGGIRVNNPIVLKRKWFMETFRRGIIKGGFLDGWQGIIQSLYQGFSVFISYAKVYEKQRNY